MRLLSIGMAVLLLSGLQQQDKKLSATQQSTQSDQRGTQESPLVVKVVPTPKPPEETSQDAKDRNQKTANDRNLVRLTGVLAIVGFLQFLVYAYQAQKLRETVKSAGEQSAAMERHIDEAARSATAMETIAKTIDTGNRAIMRAYLTVTIGTAVFQQRRPGQDDLKFVARPNLVNTGNTTARKVRIRRTAAIVPHPVPNDFVFPIPKENDDGDATVSAHLSYIMASGVDNFVPYGEVSDIKEGIGRCLCTWGLVTYEDIFGDRHTTKFAQTLYWNPDGSVYGIYLPGQNDAD
jgi:hypothetical protein